MHPPEILGNVHSVLENLNVTDYKIICTGTVQRGEGFGSHIYFFQIISPEGHAKGFEFAVKASSKDRRLRNNFPLKQIFLKEIWVYKDVKEAFETLRKDAGLEEPLEFVPQCYRTCEGDDLEVLVFENLRVQGFAVLDKKVPWPPEAAELALIAYGTWHALSFALRAKKPNTFKALVKDNVNMYPITIQNLQLPGAAYDEFVKARDRMASEGYDVKDLCFDRSTSMYALSDMYLEDPNRSVILHGDCWTNNFLFKKDEDNVATDIRFVDWQCSGVASPVFDLSHFIYACCETDTYKNVEEYLGIYHHSLSETLTELGCNPEDVYSYKDLLDHWQKFAHFGLIVGCMIKKFCLMKKNVDLDAGKAIQEGRDLSMMYNFPVEDNEVFYNQVKANLLHYCKNRR